MTTNGRAFDLLVDNAFPVNPMPTRFFWEECEDSLDRDIPQELQKRLAARIWKDVTLEDWARIGTPPAVAKFYLDPAAFIYYLPSLLIGAFECVERIDFALEVLVPFNRTRLVRGKWGADFSRRISAGQREVLSIFLLRVRVELWDVIGLANQELLQSAESIWSKK